MGEKQYEFIKVKLNILFFLLTEQNGGKGFMKPTARHKAQLGLVNILTLFARVNGAYKVFSLKN